MRTLYLRVLDHLTEGMPETATATARRREAVYEALSERFPADVLAAHLRQLPPNYLLSTPPETIGDHLSLIEAAAGGTALDHDRLGDVERLTIVTRDRPGILSLVAGTLAVHNVNVLGGTAYTRDDGTAIEVMYVSDGLGHEIDERRWARVCEDVPRALAEEFPLDERLAETRAAYRSSPPAAIPTTVHVDNAGSDRYTIVEVIAADRLGLLYAITHALHGLSLDIHLAKVDTIGREVVDAFYVLRENGRRVEAPDEVERLRQRVVDAVAALDT
jgi:[protein-PII] uridylyltransferase